MGAATTAFARAMLVVIVDQQVGVVYVVDVIILQYAKTQLTSFRNLQHRLNWPHHLQNSILKLLHINQFQPLQPSVPLQTAYTMMHNPSNPQRSIEVRILFDSGSQKSCITERAKSVLALESTGEQLLSIATFESSKVQEKVCAIVNAGLCLRGYPPMSMFPYVVPTICDPLVCQPIATCIKKSNQFALTEIEAVLNSRPLSYISAEELEEPLPSSHLLVG